MLLHVALETPGRRSVNLSSDPLWAKSEVEQIGPLKMWMRRPETVVAMEVMLGLAAPLFFASIKVLESRKGMNWKTRAQGSGFLY